MFPRLAWSIIAGGLLWPASALPSTPVLPCTSVSPAPGAHILVSTPVPVTLSSGWRAGAAGFDQVGLELFGPTGGRVPLTAIPDPFLGTPQDYLLRPQAPLVPGTYHVAYKDQCTGGSHGWDFDVIDAPAPELTTTGTITADPPAVVSKCSFAYQVVNLTLRPSAEAVAHGPLLLYQVSVNGKVEGTFNDLPRYGGSYYGGLRELPARWTLAVGCRGLLVDESFRAPGKHEVVVRAHLAGAASDPAPATLTIDLDCAGVPPPDPECARKPTPPPPDAGAPAPEDPPPPKRPPTGGCSLGGRRPTGALFALALALWMVRRHQRAARRNAAAGARRH
jgi:hypothetical protein